MTLEAVPFHKGRAQKPRLSSPRAPAAHPSARYWSEAERDILRQHYATRGAEYCTRQLPNRTLRNVYAQANALGLRSGRMPTIRRRHDVPAIDAAIQQAAPTLTRKGALTALAKQLDAPPWLVKKRAIVLGLSQLHRKEPPWTAAEDALIRRVPLHDPSRAAQTFRSHGFARTPTSIIMRSKRLALSRRYTATLSATAAGKVLGVDGKTVTDWIAAGLIGAGRRGTKRLPQQGGDTHTIERTELRRFVLENLERLDIRKVDKFAFVDLLVADPHGRETSAEADPS